MTHKFTHKTGLYGAVVAAGLLAAAAAAVWAGQVSTTETVLVISADGTIITPAVVQVDPNGSSAPQAKPATGQIVTREGTWTFGSPPNASGDYPVLLNGAPVGFGVSLQVTNGHLYARQKSGGYWVRWPADHTWNAVIAAPAQGTVASTVSLAVVLPKIPDNSPAGTLIARATVAMSPANANFTGALVSDSALFTAHGSDVVLARALKPADDGAPFVAHITALQ